MDETNVKKNNKNIKILVIVIFVIALVVGLYFYFQYSTYKNMHIVEIYENESAGDGNYIQYLDGVLKYSKVGIAMLTEEGTEIWNQPCEMSSPMAEVRGESAVVADKKGTSILVFQKDGLKGEIQTTKPIENITVSEQGIVAAVLQNEETPWVMCYDAKGNILVEHQASMSNTGYPIDIAISDDGEVLLVSYLCTSGTSIFTNVVFYHFGEAGADKTDHQVAQCEYAGAIIPATAFIDEDTSILISDHSLIRYEGLDEPKEAAQIELDKEIKSVAYNEKYIAFVLRNSENSGYELRVYRASGQEVTSTQFEGEYTNIKLEDDQIILYAGNTCAIFNMRGICKFQGTLENNIVNIFKVSGLNKYMVISAGGFMEMKLAK